MKETPIKKILILFSLLSSLLGLTTISFASTVALNPGSVSLQHCEIFSEKDVSQERVQEVGEFYEKAYVEVGKDLGGYASKKMKIYIYNFQKSLVEGLQQFSGFSQQSAEFFANSGTPRPLKYVMHAPPSMDLSAIVHEYTHCVIEEFSGEAFKSVKWMDEGLAEFEGYKVGEKGKGWTFFEVKQSAESGTFFNLKKISSEEQWHKIVGKERILMYKEALIAVDYFARKYGIANALKVLQLVNRNYTQSQALKRTIGVDLEDFEKEFKRWMLQLEDIKSTFAENSMRDWKDIKPIVTDPSNDSKSNIRGTDIKAVYLVKDQDFFYIMYESYPNSLGEVAPISYTFNIDCNVQSAEFTIRYQPGASSDGRTWFWDFPGGPDYSNTKNLRYIKGMRAEWSIKPDSAQILEMKFPVLYIGCPDKFKSQFGTSIGGKQVDFAEKVIYSKE